MTLNDHKCVGPGCAHCMMSDSIERIARATPPAPHFIAGSGARGNLYDGCAVYRTYDAAVDALAATFQLGRTRRTRLYQQGFLELAEGDGAEYCEIRKCSCTEAWQHDDNMSAEEWKAGQP